MKLREGQTFMSLYYEPAAVEVATGGTDSFAAARTWARETARLGQVATPESIATLMAEWVISAGPRTILDPAAGLGGLLAACRRLNPKAECVGVEMDADTLALAKSSAPRGTRLILADYLQADTGLFDGIISNPPYVKAQRLAYTEGTWRALEERLGTPLDRLTNLYALFLLKIWEDLAPGGRAAVILPAEFLNANFGVPIKERLVRTLRPAAILVFSPSLNLFSDALTTSAIVLLDKSRRARATGWIRRADSLDEARELVRALCANRAPDPSDHMLALNRLEPAEKWLNRLLNPHDPAGLSLLPHRVGDYFMCKRGIATGANDFFCLSRSEMQAHGLVTAHVSPCITKATDAAGLVFTSAKFNALVTRDRRCFLLNPSRNGTDLDRYLARGQKQGIPERHLPSHRPVWYLPENRPPADIWAAVFSRQQAKFILNRSGARNLTCFHGLYARPGHEQLAPLMTLFLNSSLGRRAFAEVNRFYGDGLNKVEPKDVEAMPCPAMPEWGKKEAIQLGHALAELENLPTAERSVHLDELVKCHFGVSHSPAKPASSARDRAQNHRPSARHTHRAAPV